MIIAVDFDGTIVEHKYPAIGRELPFAIETLRKLRSDRHKLILWTVREGVLLEEALAFCRERGLEFYAVNRDYPEEERDRNNHFSRKLKAVVKQTPLEFIRGIKMKHAAEMLRQKTATIQDVMLAVGYNDHKSFVQVFRDTFGVSPSEYQRDNKL